MRMTWSMMRHRRLSSKTGRSARCWRKTRGSPSISIGGRLRSCSTRPPIPAYAPRWLGRQPSERGLPPTRSLARGQLLKGARKLMDIGASIFFTEYSISPAELGSAREERGFDSLWVAEHSHIPVVRRINVPTGGELERQYYDVM